MTVGDPMNLLNLLIGLFMFTLIGAFTAVAISETRYTRAEMRRISAWMAEHPPRDQETT